MSPPESPQRQQPAAEPPSIVAAIFEAVGKQVVGPVGEILDATFLHGPVAAALRQGADEIGMALRAFPDSIQTHEPGSVLNPLFSDIANNRRADAWGNGPEPVPSVADILADPQRFAPPEPQQPTQGMDNDKPHGMSM